MIPDLVRAQSVKYLAYAAVGATVLVTPWFSLDPINLVKMVAVSVFGLMAFFTVVSNLGGFFTRARILVLLICLFVLQLVLAFVMGDGAFTNQFFGAFGRNTGFLSYLVLALILPAAAVVVTPYLAGRIAYALIGVGVFNAVYGLIQFFELDPIDWANPYNRILGTLGNPNFASSLLGMAAVVALALVFGGGIGLAVRVLGVVFVAVALFLAYKSDSFQGVAVALLGALLVGYQVAVKVLGWAWVRIPYLVVSVLGFVLAVVGALQKGPLSSYLYQDSVTYRGDYWRAGIAMIKSNPVFGVGLDSYGDYYRASRNMAAVVRRGPDVTSNSAHNVFLDIGSNGGVPLLLIYLGIVFLGMRSAYRILSRAKTFDWVAVGLVAAWAAYLAQSAISINQLGLAVWGWLLPGAIIGMDLNSEVGEAPRVKGKRREQVPAKNYLLGVLGGVMGLLLSIWPFVHDIGFRSSLTKGDPAKIESAALGFPRNIYHLDFAAGTFASNKLNDKAIEMYRKSIENNPRDYAAWKGLSGQPSLSAEERARVLATMRELDPLNSEIPKQ